MPEFNDTLTVKVFGETFEFRIPGPLEMARIGSRALEMRRTASPGTAGSDLGMDPMSRDLFLGMALLETQLVRADCRDNWPFFVDEKTKTPAVRADKFPPRSTPAVMEMYRAFSNALDEFLFPGDRDGKPAGEETVDGVPDVPGVPMGTATPISA